MTSLLILIVSLALVLGVVAWEWTHTTSPGPLNPTHQAISKLQGNAGCAECHGGRRVAMADACLTCHHDIKTQVDAQVGVHGVTSRNTILACAACHGEHGGAGLQLVADRSFTAAGLPNTNGFDHSKLTKYSLTGRHAQLKCEHCHHSAHAATLAAGQKRFIGRTQECVSCHKDVHEGSYGNQCVACHGQIQDFKKAPDFVHTPKFPLVDAHQIANCKKCHEPHGTTSVVALRSNAFVVRACAACHRDVHEGSFGNNCAKCHGQIHPFRQAPGFAHTDRFPLVLGHQIQGCKKCHEKSGSTSVVALLGSNFSVRSCIACHKDPHESAYGQNCASCHSNRKWTDGVSQIKHIATFPLTGGHGGLSCGRCHEKAGPHSVASLSAKSLPIRGCVECHASPHKTTTATIASAQRVTESQICTLCHQSEHRSFLYPTAAMTPAMHKATGFALDVPHAKVECAACHKEIGKRKPLPATPTLATDFQRLFPGRGQNDCAQCHADPHRGQFSASISKESCIACHAATHFTPNTFDVAQHDATHYPLTGAHRATACSACHAKKEGFTKFVGTATACASCHADFHRGKFDVALKAAGKSAGDCAHCHTTASFSKVSWTAREHKQWTSYPLNASHVSAACLSCHKPHAKPDDHGFTWGVASSRCADCHADPHAGQFVRNNATDCARCHTDSAKFAITTFDHQRDSTFKLDATHAKVACAACHRAVQITPTIKIIRYRPLGNRCEDCHSAGIPKEGR